MHGWRCLKYGIIRPLRRSCDAFAMQPFSRVGVASSQVALDGWGMTIEQASAAPSGNVIPFPEEFRRLEASPDLIEKLPLAIYACDAAGLILWFNSRAAALWGRTPQVGDDGEKFCGAHRLHFDGRQISREETPMATVLRTIGEPFDPAKHEAMMVQPSTTAEPDSVLQVVQRGYELNGRLLRPARVIVAKAP